MDGAAEGVRHPSPVAKPFAATLAKCRKLHPIKDDLDVRQSRLLIKSLAQNSPIRVVDRAGKGC
jgi:hypothetical protein